MKTAQDGFIVAAGAAEPPPKATVTDAADGTSRTTTQHFGDWPNDAGFNASAEMRDPVELKVTGTFPSWTAGTLLRAGPGASSIPRSNPSDGNFNVSHWFDGFAHLHKFEIVPNNDGSTKVFYQSRSHMDEAIEEARRTGKLSGITFAQKRDPCDTLYKKFKTMFQPIVAGGTHTENVGVVIQPPITSSSGSNKNADPNTKSTTTTVTSDKSTSKTFSLSTLEPLGVTNQSTLHPLLKGPLSGAHACIDPTTGETYNYNLQFAGKAIYRVFCTSASTGQTKILATIADPRVKGAYIHSMLMTQHYIILCVWPAFFSSMGASILWERNLLDAIAPFNPSQKCHWFVIDRSGKRGVVKKFTSPGMFCFHTVNAWEETSPDDGNVDVLAELCTFKDTAILHRFYYDNLVSDRKGAVAYSGTSPAINTSVSLSRYRLAGIEAIAGGVDVRKSSATSTAYKTAREAQLVSRIPSPNAGDLPTINPAYAAKKHRYVYSLIDTGRSSFLDSIGKTDTLTNTCVRWMEEGCTPGEAVFVADPQGTGEDDGVLLSVVLHGRTGRSFLLCLDARDLREVARADVDVSVGLGFHGVHLGA